MIHVLLDIAPVAWGRVKRGAYGQAYVPAKTLNFKNTVASLLRKQLGPTAPRTGPLCLLIRFIVPSPKKPKFATPAVRPDLDNYLKAFKDAANGVLWLDDAQIVEVYAKKLYDQSGGKPRIEIELSEVTA